MSPALYAPLFAGGSFIAMLGLLEIGRRIGARRLAADGESARTGVGAVEGAVFGLLGLLIAFTFSGAASRFDNRRDQITVEANNIGTAWLRIDLLPAQTQPAMRDLFRRYLDARLATYQKLPDLAAARAEATRATQLQSEIWSLAVTGLREEKSPAATMLLLASLNDMIDITTTRTMAALAHPPVIVFVMLAALSSAAALLAGVAMAGARHRNWIHIVCFAAITTGTIYVILDLEYPRYGYIRLDAFDQVLIDLRQTMK